jgi:transposase
MPKTKTQPAKLSWPRIIGLDIHPDIFSACVMQGQTNADATVLRRFKDQLIADLETWAQSHLRVGDLVLMEAGSNSFEAVRRLAKVGISACVLESAQVGKTASSYLDDDLIAAERIARSYLTGISKVVWVPDEKTAHRRELLHAYVKATAQETRATNELKSYLNQYHIRLGRRDPKSQRTQQWVFEQHPWSEMQKSILTYLLNNLGHCAGQAADLHRLIAEEVLVEPLMRGCLRLLGIGVINAFAIVATVGDINRFSSPQKLIAYLGLNPGLKKSGNDKKIPVGVGRRGRSEMRRLLVQGAQAVFRQPRSNPLRDWGWNIFLRKGNRNIAVAAIARKLAVQLWHLLKGHGVMRDEQQKSLELKLTKISRELGKLGRIRLQLPETVLECVILLMGKINQPIPQST